VGSNSCFGYLPSDLAAWRYWPKCAGLRHGEPLPHDIDSFCIKDATGWVARRFYFEGEKVGATARRRSTASGSGDPMKQSREAR
jgi:hypothetical protein